MVRPGAVSVSACTSTSWIVTSEKARRHRYPGGSGGGESGVYVTARPSSLPASWVV